MGCGLEIIRMRKAVTPVQQEHFSDGDTDSGLQHRFLILVAMTSVCTIICNTPYMVSIPLKPFTEHSSIDAGGENSTI